jgi:putative ABC transport system ATP-binding protein
VPAGAATAVVGPSGAGKSTLLAVLAGLERPDVGAVEIAVPTARMSVVLQNYGLIRLLTAAETVELALQTADRDAAEIVDRAADELERFGLGGLADRRIDELSGGQQQRLALARALITRPELLIADELTSELDPRNRARVLDEVLGLRAQGVTVVLATHDPDVASRCDHVIDVGGARSTASAESREARRSAARLIVEEQQRRIDAQREIVDRESAKLRLLEQARDRLLDADGGADD